VDRSIEINRAWWDERAPAHAASADYALARFLSDPAFLSDVVRFDLPRLGDVGGRRGVHLQCHIGTDTISLARLGARMTGLDASPVSVAQARDLATRTVTDVRFVEADVYRAAEVLGSGTFELVFTGVGALCWLPSVSRWAEVVAALLAPGGRLFIRDGHPMMWALDSREGQIVTEYPYFETDEPIAESGPGTYVETTETFAHNLTHEWNHGLGEIITALLDAGMAITGLTEHDSVPWDALPGLMHQIGGGEWQLIDRPRRVAHSYTLQAVKRG
jgi:SAM-dependent methyltransferase